jgi:hypothetical protein
VICPKCKFSFFTRKYSTATELKTVQCIWCDHRFTAPLRTDARRVLKELLHDDLFEDSTYKDGDTVQRVQWMINKLRGDDGHRND